MDEIIATINDGLDAPQKLLPENIQDSKFSQKFSHFLTRTNVSYATDNISLLTGRGMENRLLENLIEFLPDGVIIAGGFMTSLFESEKDAKDIDFFFTSKSAFCNFANYILDQKQVKADGCWALEGYKLKEGTTLANINIYRYLIFTHPTKPDLQLLKMVMYSDAAHVIDSFDLTVAQFAVEKGGKFTYNPLSFLDISRKRIVLHRIQFMGSTLRRIIKYSKKGFYACPGSLANVCQQIKDFKGPIEANDIFYVD